MSKVKFTVAMFTARSDNSMVGYPKIHIFEYFIDSLRKQTFKDFEVLIVDRCYEQRKDYFKSYNEDFEIIHVPVKPNIWTDYYSFSTSRNTCLLHARGEIVMVIADCVYLNKDTLATAVGEMEKYSFLYNAYQCNFGDEFQCWGIRPDSVAGMGRCGMTGKIECFEELNGWDEVLDGSWGYEDLEFVERLNFKGYKIGINRNVLIHQKHGDIDVKVKLLNLKCPKIWCHYVREKMEDDKEYRPNTLFSDNDFNLLADKCNFINLKDNFCSLIKYSCPFDGFVDKKIDPRYRDIFLYKHPSLLFNLKEQRRDKCLGLQGTI